MEIEYEMLQVFYEIAFKEPNPMMVDSGVYFYRVMVRLKELSCTVRTDEKPRIVRTLSRVR